MKVSSQIPACSVRRDHRPVTLTRAPAQHNNFIKCDKALHIDDRGMGGEKVDCLNSDMTSLKAAMQAPAWSKYGLSAKMSPSEQCSPVNASAIGNCFEGNVQNWEVWCGKDYTCMNDQKWLSRESGNKNGTCGQRF